MMELVGPDKTDMDDRERARRGNGNGATMLHKEKRQAGRYVPAFSWHKSIRLFLDEHVVERPLLNVCSGPYSDYGDMRVDRFVKPIPPGAVADWTALPFPDDSFAAVFADPPWNLSQTKSCADFCKEAL